jgi:hypothetical protein
MKLNHFYRLSLVFISLIFVLNTSIASSLLTSSLRRFTPQAQVAVSAYGAKRFVKAFPHPVEYYARATTDVGFKQLLDPSNDKENMLSFLNTFVPNLQNDPATDVDTAPLPIPALPRTGDSKLTFMDMHVTSQKGFHYIVEMQAIRHLMFDERALYYLCNTYGRQLSEKQLQQRDWFLSLKPTIAIQVLDYDTNRAKGLQDKQGIIDSLPDRVKANPMKYGEPIKHLKFQDTHSGQTLDYLQMIQIELPRHPKDLYPPKADFTEKDWWFSVLRHSSLYTPQDIESFKKQGIKLPRFIEKGFERLEVQNWNPQLQNDYRVQAVDRDLYAQTLEIERNAGITDGEVKQLERLIKQKKLSLNEALADPEISEAVKVELRKKKF